MEVRFSNFVYIVNISVMKCKNLLAVCSAGNTIRQSLPVVVLFMHLAPGLMAMQEGKMKVSRQLTRSRPE